MDINATGGLSQPGTVMRPVRGETSQPVNSEGRGGLQQTEASQPVSPQQAQATPQMEEAVSSIRAFAQSVQRNLNFSLDDATGRVVVKVTDGDSGELIRQIPSEDALRLAESLDEVRSLLFRAEA